MRVSEALEALRPFVGVPFRKIFAPAEMADLRTDKGIVGKTLEKSIGLSNSSATLDFEDGELKTNKCRPNGTPRETMFITQIASMIDDLLKPVPFSCTALYAKTRNILYVPVCKDGPCGDWMFLPPIQVDMAAPAFTSTAAQLEKDYYSIAKQLATHIGSSADGFIHTSNGHFIQVRSKDAKPYHPIYSRTYRRNVSDKNHAFYFKKEFMVYIQGNSPDYPYARR